MRRAFSFASAVAIACAAALVCLGTAAVARAGAGPRVDATPVVKQPPELFALIVTNNKSLERDRPDLHYADDDGARYHALFRAVAPPENVVLLTTFDVPSARLYPALATSAQAPTRKAVLAAAERLGGVAAAARKAGKEVVFYFVFAGHGDVRGGRGFLELADARFGPKDIERHVLDAVPATSTHLLIDSCNSFFVVNPRKPGGRRWASPRDVSHGFSKRYPHVGVFLSTSAEGEVYEWSEIQGGIFSHEVRSGLSGAADADGDGVVSYDELAAFVSTANEQIKNAHYRPKVFARAPFARRDAPLLDLREARGRRIRVGGTARRIWLRDGDGTRLVDLHKSEKGELRLVIPIGDAETLVAQERVVDADGRPRIVQQTLPQGRASVVLATLTHTAPASARGRDAVFRRLFATPFGRDKLDEWRKKPPNKGELYGISGREAIRIRHYLRHFAGAQRRGRRVEGGFALASSLMMVGFGTALYAQQRNIAVSTPLFGVAGVLGAISWSRFGGTSEGENLYEAYRWALRTSGLVREELIARTEARLEELAEQERLERRAASLTLWTLGGVTLVSTFALSFAANLPRPDAVYLVGAAAVSASFVLWGLAVGFGEATSDRVLRLFRGDPDLRARTSLSFGLAPLPGGAALALSGRF